MSEADRRDEHSEFVLKEGEVKKRILAVGTGPCPIFTNGAKVLFHFRTEKCNSERSVIDDTRKMGRPMEFILGWKFKLEVWESFVKTMTIGEVAEYTVEKSLLGSYPWVSKLVRQAYSKDSKKAHGHSEHNGTSGHCCGMMGLSNEGMGFPDLDDLVKNPQNLKFTFELLEVIMPGDYKKETWEMNDEEKLSSLPKLREEGNALYKNNNYVQASQKYAEALGRLEQLIIKEKPGDEEWTKLEKMKIPYLLNYAQCKLLEGNYYQVIEHTTTVLKHEPDNVKALFRRAQAHVGAWNPEDARQDYEKIKTLDKSLLTVVNKEMGKLDDLIKKKNEEDRLKLMGKLF